MIPVPAEKWLHPTLHNWLSVIRGDRADNGVMASSSKEESRMSPQGHHSSKAARSQSPDPLRRSEGRPGGATLPGRDGAHDFDFQTGRWHVHNERLVKRLQGCTEWETFEATNRARLLPGGLGNMDEFHTDHWPGFVGMSLRLYDPHTRLWSIYWASNQKGVLDPPVVGSFSDGVGVFEGHDELDGRPIVVRFTWSDITPTGRAGSRPSRRTRGEPGRRTGS